ncbi:MAG: hypothetical protein IKE01_07020 [Clostridia bacterium]|nr:hypothetical protein [Clostridia bacterium]
MKFFKKINIGLVLAIIAIVAVVIYCISVESNRKSSKEDIKKACEEFIEITDKYSVLPEQYQVLGEEGSKINLDTYYSEMEDALKGVTTTDQTANVQKRILSELLQKQLLNTDTINTNFDRKITKISSYEFDGNQVTVSFSSKITIKQKYKEINVLTGETMEKMKDDSIDSDSESITLEQKDGKWKIVSTNLTYSANGNNMTMPFSL